MIEPSSHYALDIANELLDLIPSLLRRIRADIPRDTDDIEPEWRDILELRATNGQIKLLRVLMTRQRCTMQELADQKEKSMSDTHSKMALLVMDVQVGIVTRYAQTGDILTPISTAITAARAASIPVIYVAMAFRPGYPEVSPRNKSFSAIKQQQSSLSAPMTTMEIHPAIAPQPTDIAVTKRRVSAFSGSDLEVVLRAQDISHLVLCGIATSGVVLSTLREAADKDYQLTVLADCCVDNDEEVQRVLLSKVFPQQAEVVQAQSWAMKLK
jgi:nicotinamidase-related amidase